MTKEQKDSIKKDIDRTITMLARNHNVYEQEIVSILENDYVDDDDFIIVPWPEIQALMLFEGFDINVSLANDEWSLAKYGSSAYFVNKKWLNSL